MIKDISGSMVGLPSLWSSAVASSVIQMAKRNKMKIGYCEFNEKAYLYKKYGKWKKSSFEVMMGT